MGSTKNKIINSFTQDFCSILEYQLCKTLKNSEEEQIKKIWCDGISHEYLTATSRKIITKAWIGKDGQDEYEMTLRFGNEALNASAKNLAIINCIPSEKSTDWITIDIENKIIELQLK